MKTPRLSQGGLAELRSTYLKKIINLIVNTLKSNSMKIFLRLDRLIVKNMFSTWIFTKFIYFTRMATWNSFFVQFCSTTLQNLVFAYKYIAQIPKYIYCSHIRFDQFLGKSINLDVIELSASVINRF